MAEGNTPVHRYHAGAKLVLLFVYLIAVLSISPYEISRLAPFVFFPVVLVSMSEIPVRFLLQRLVPVIPFALLMGLPNLFMIQTVAFSIGGLQITYGMISFISLILKTFLTVSGVIILLATTRFTDILEILRAIKIPEIILTLLSLSYRYLTLIFEEAETMKTAYTLRSGKTKGISIKHAGSFIGLLLLRSFDRAERVTFAINCRGYGINRNHVSFRPIEKKEILVGIILLGSLLILRFWNINEIITQWVLSI